MQLKRFLMEEDGVGVIEVVLILVGSVWSLYLRPRSTNF